MFFALLLDNDRQRQRAGGEPLLLLGHIAGGARCSIGGGSWPSERGFPVVDRRRNLRRDMRGEGRGLRKLEEEWIGQSGI